MMEGVPLNAMIAIGTVLFGAITAWVTVKGSVKTHSDKLINLAKQVSALWEKKDTSIVDSASLETEVKYLRRDVDELREEQKYQRRNIK